MVNIGGLAEVNRSLGYGAGNQVIGDVVARIESVASKLSILYRSKSTQFVLIREDVSLEDTYHIKELLIDCLSQPYEVEGRKVEPEVSVSSAHYSCVEEQPLAILNLLERRGAANVLRIGGDDPQGFSQASPGKEEPSKGVDAVTGLPYGGGFLRLANAFREAHVSDDLALIKVDLGNFRTFNEWYGREREMPCWPTWGWRCGSSLKATAASPATGVATTSGW